MNKTNYQQTTIADINLINAEYKNFSFKRHFHLDYHFGLLTQGEQTFYYQGSKYSTGPGQIQLMPAGAVHDGNTVEKSGFKSKIVSVSPTWLNDLSYELTGHKHFKFSQHCIENPQLFYQFYQLHLILSNPLMPQLSKECIPFTLFSTMITQYSNNRTAVATSIGDKNIGLLKDYLMAKLDEKISLKNLAELCNLSESQLLRQFKRSTGMTPYAWLARLRLEQALVLIKSGELSTHVAYQVGFYDQAHFVNAFKQAYGVPPSQLQK
jgi:AraC-like DNA-binding protein